MLIRKSSQGYNLQLYRNTTPGAVRTKTFKDGNMTSINVFGGGNDVGNDAGEFIDVTYDGGYIVFSDTDSKGSKGPNNFGFLYIKNP